VIRLRLLQYFCAQVRIEVWELEVLHLRSRQLWMAIPVSRLGQCTRKVSPVN
jgi:hypothetical protein